jgi:ubiquinone/menaquinone biosynthesis C-methylase UbiE
MKFYDGIAEWYDLIVAKRDYKCAADFFEDVFKKHGNVKEVLDIGCGTGSHAKYLSEKGYSVTGLDESESMLRIARKRAPKAKFIKGHMMNFSSEKHFDAVLCIFTVINDNTSLEELHGSFRKINHLLKPGGLLIFDAGPSKKSLHENSTRYLFNSDGNKSVFCLLKMLPCRGREFSLNAFVMKKVGSKVDMDVYDDERVGAFSMGEIRKTLKKTGFSYHIYEPYRMKRYSRFKKYRNFPIFVGEKK